VNAGGLKVTGGLTVYDGNVFINTAIQYNGAVSITGGVSVGSGGVQVTGGLTVMNQGFYTNAGISVTAGGMAITGGVTIQTGGANVVTGGVTVGGSGIYVIGGSTVLNGLYVTTTGMTINGWLYYSGTSSTSDRFLKSKFTVIKDSLSKVKKLRGVYFSWLKPNEEKEMFDRRQVGLIAQDVMTVLPEAVQRDEKHNRLTVDYEKLVPLLIEAIRELEKKVNYWEDNVDAWSDKVVSCKENMDIWSSKFDDLFSSEEYKDRLDFKKPEIPFPSEVLGKKGKLQQQKRD